VNKPGTKLQDEVYSSMAIEGRRGNKEDAEKKGAIWERGVKEMRREKQKRTVADQKFR